MLKRKSAMGTQLEQPRDRPLRAMAPKAKAMPVAAEETPAPKPDDMDDASLSTTERLLARKRKRQEEKDI